MTIREMKNEDYGEVVALWRAAGMPFSHTGRESRPAVETLISEFPALTLVAEEDGRIVGVVMGTHDHRKGWVNRLAVHPDFRRRGVAAALGARLEKEYHKLGIEVIAALVMAGNEKSISLCRGAGMEHMEDVLYFSKRTRADA